MDLSAIPDAVPKVEPLSPYGNPEYYDVNGKRYYPMKTSMGYVEQGVASWYGIMFHGRRTSSGDTYDMYQMTAAHRTLPLPTYVEVTNPENGRKVVLKVNDRGPFYDDRIIDLSYVAAKKLGIAEAGTGRVKVRAIDPRSPNVALRPPVRRAKQERGRTSFFLQVGAFSDAIKAEQFRRQIHQATREAVRIQAAQGPTSPVYRVQIGPFANVEVADRVVQELSKLGVGNHHVVMN
jgi:rare lipoprotein A